MHPVSVAVSRLTSPHQDVPSLAQAQIYERTADFANLSLTTPPVAQPADPIPNGQDARERSRLLAIRLFRLAQKCRVSGHSIHKVSFE